MSNCEECGRETARRVCARCKFEAAQAVPLEVVEQLKQEAEAAERDRMRRRAPRRYVVRTFRVVDVVVVQEVWTPRERWAVDPVGVCHE